MSWLPSVLTSGVVSATVTLGTNWWLQRPRPDLRMVVGAQTVEDADRLLRANNGDTNWINHPHWLPLAFVRLTNYGDGTAYDIKLSGTECRPRVWIGDSGVVPIQGEPPEVKWPLWSDTVAALEPGDWVNIYVMASPDGSRPKPVLTASWPRSPGRGLGRRTSSYDLANARAVESGWPGEKEALPPGRRR